LLAQLARTQSKIPDSLQNLYNIYQNGQPPTGCVKEALRSVLERAGQTFFIIDALDECRSYDGERMQLFTVLKDLSVWALPNLHILITSRREQDIVEALAPLVTLPPIGIQSKQVDADIGLHVRTQLENDPKLKKWSSEIKEEIEKALVEGADGMYESPHYFSFPNC
jgi:hypothetical protein